VLLPFPHEKAGNLQGERMIRIGTTSDIEAVEEMNLFSGSRSCEIKEDRLTVIDQDGVAAGFVVESKKGLLGRPYIEYLAVSDLHRRKGLATALIKAIESKHYGKRLFISTESNNAAMLSLLRRCGYVQSGRISNANLSGEDEIYFFKDIF
jgi:ribosomal protein S18 acetylase RimI-like enzyme